MAHVEVSALSKAQKDELTVTYAALLLHDGELEITEEKLNKVITASGNSVEGYWPGLFAKALKGKDVSALLSNAGSASAGPAPAASPPTRLSQEGALLSAVPHLLEWSREQEGEASSLGSSQGSNSPPRTGAA